MDVLLGYFGLPSVLSSNYIASSLNLLFFYSTWAMLVLSLPPLRVELLGSFAIRFVFYWIPTILFTAFDGLMPGLSSNLKIRRGRQIAGRDLFWVATNGLLNQGIATAIQGVIHFTYAHLLTRKTPVFDIGMILPLPWHIGKEILLIFAVRELATFTDIFSTIPAVTHDYLAFTIFTTSSRSHLPSR
jgi:hypothetical protein